MRNSLGFQQQLLAYHRLAHHRRRRMAAEFLAPGSGMAEELEPVGKSAWGLGQKGIENLDRASGWAERR
jgi:hypothetical protein